MFKKYKSSRDKKGNFPVKKRESKEIKTKQIFPVEKQRKDKE